MTEQERIELINKIEQAEDVELLQQITIPCTFYGERITAELFQSVSQGHKLSKEYVWEQAFNLDGVHGGYNLVDFIYTIEELI